MKMTTELVCVMTFICFFLLYLIEWKEKSHFVPFADQRELRRREWEREHLELNARVRVALDFAVEFERANAARLMRENIARRMEQYRVEPESKVNWIEEGF